MSTRAIIVGKIPRNKTTNIIISWKAPINKKEFIIFVLIFE
jgi:hypothetical protein